jgi:ubiquinone/menaquinone biosynthesis C-methylase UbiE
MSRDQSQPPPFTPAAGRALLTPAYDLGLRLLTRERRWRDALLDQIAPRDGETILDVGCGTGTLAVLLKRRAPGVRVVGLDPDSQALALAAAKANRAGVKVEWRQGFAREAARLGRFDHVVSSLVFHQVPPDGKVAGLKAMFEAVRPGGALHVADYCRQPDRLMRFLFTIIQALDGRRNTQANADGAVEQTLEQLGRRTIRAQKLIRTPTGAISLFRLDHDASTR